MAEFTEQFINAFMAGRQLKQQKEKIAQEAEDRKLQRDHLKAQIKAQELADKLKYQMTNRQLAQQNVEAMQGQPGKPRTVQDLVGQIQSQVRPVGTDINTGQMEETPSAVPVSYEQPNEAITVPGIDVAEAGIQSPSYSITPQNREQVRASTIQDLLTKARIAAQAKGMEAQSTLDPELAKIREQAQVTAQNQQAGREFTAAQNQAQRLFQAEQNELTRKQNERLSAMRIASENKRALFNQRGSKASQNAVSQSNKFTSDPVVKEYLAAASNASMINQLPKTGLTSADNIAAIYAFAKVMDPNSVVREGEYATVQKYAQAWKDKFGFDVQRIFANKEFLSDDAIANMKQAVGRKMDPVTRAYRSIYNQYKNKIVGMTGDAGDADLLIDYESAYTVPTSDNDLSETPTEELFKMLQGKK